MRKQRACADWFVSKDVKVNSPEGGREGVLLIQQQCLIQIPAPEIMALMRPRDSG